MADVSGQDPSAGRTPFSPEIQRALDAVTEVPEDLEAQAEFFDKIHEALSGRLRDEN